jgi:hypothetical protein
LAAAIAVVSAETEGPRLANPALVPHAPHAVLPREGLDDRWRRSVLAGRPKATTVDGKKLVNDTTSSALMPSRGHDRVSQKRYRMISGSSGEYHDRRAPPALEAQLIFSPEDSNPLAGLEKAAVSRIGGRDGHASPVRDRPRQAPCNRSGPEKRQSRRNSMP